MIYKTYHKIFTWFVYKQIKLEENMENSMELKSILIIHNKQLSIKEKNDFKREKNGYLKIKRESIFVT